MNAKREVVKRKIIPIVVMVLTLIGTFFYIRSEIRRKRNVRESIFPEPQTDSSYARVGVYLKGNLVNFKKLLSNYGIAIDIIFHDLEYFRGSDVELNDVIDLLVFTTEGLSSVHSVAIERKLEKFVRNGGNLLILCQEYGHDYSVLPGNIDGYGWKEDGRSKKRWAYINVEHPVFSGQDSVILNCNFDGYLTIFPFYSEILLMRAEDLMPVLISYNYGAGNIIITSLYPDYGFKAGKITQDEVILFRDLLTWAMNPSLKFQYVKPSDYMCIPLRIKNFSDTTLNVEKLELKVYTPDKQLYKTEEMEISKKIRYKSYIRKYWRVDDIPDIHGIWMINYSLLDSNRNILQGEKTGAIFAPEKEIYSKNMKPEDLKIRVWTRFDEKKENLSKLDIMVVNKSASIFRGKLLITNKGLDEFIYSIKPVIVKQDSFVNLKFELTPEIKEMEGLFFLLFSEKQNIEPFQSAICRFWLGLNPPSEFKNEYNYIYINNVQDTISKTVKVPEGEYKIYINECISNKNEYTLGDTVRLKMKIHTNVDSKVKLVVHSKTSISDTFFVQIGKKSANRFKIKYPTKGMKRGLNRIDLNLYYDAKFIDSEYLLTSINVPDTTPPVIDINKLPDNTHACNRFGKLEARILNPGYDPTPIYDSLYYRIASIGGSRWSQIPGQRYRDNTYRYLLPELTSGTHIQCHLIVKDSMGNMARYPSVGEINYWVLSPLKTTIKEVKVNKDTTVSLRWTPLKYLLSTYCHLESDTVFLEEKKVASKFIPQYLPASLSKVSINFICNEEEYVDFKVHRVKDSLPGKVIYQSNFKIKRGENELKIPNIKVPEEGVFISIEGSKNTGVVFDGYGKGLNTTVYEGGSWTLNTPGESLIDVVFKYMPSRNPDDVTGLQSKVLPFGVYRKSKNEDWTKISEEVYDTTYTDTSVEYNNKYFYKIKCEYSNPQYSIFSKKEIISIDRSSIQD